MMKINTTIYVNIPEVFQKNGLQVIPNLWAEDHASYQQRSLKTNLIFYRLTLKSVMDI